MGTMLLPAVSLGVWRCIAGRSKRARGRCHRQGGIPSGTSV